jgi:predicted kinase
VAPSPFLIVFGGLPGTGKTTLSRALAQRFSAVHLRIDTIEQSLKAAGLAVDGTGYAIANALALDNLRLGADVVADCVNPVLVSRNGWRETAAQGLARLVEVEVICSDVDEHRSRVERRVTDIAGLVLPTWDDVARRDYEPWDRDHIVIDTASRSIDHLVDDLELRVRRK